MTKNTKKQNTKNTKKAIPAKKQEKTFLEYTQGGDSIKQALKKTQALRRVFLVKNYKSPDFKKAMEDLASKWGLSKTKYDFDASYPLKSDLAKIRTIAPFENKTRENLSPRMAVALAIAYLNRDTDDAFSRVFPSGLFLENGCLQDLLTGGYIQAKTGTEEKQSFVFNLKKIGGLFQDKKLLAIEKAYMDASII